MIADSRRCIFDDHHLLTGTARGFRVHYDLDEAACYDLMRRTTQERLLRELRWAVQSPPLLRSHALQDHGMSLVEGWPVDWSQAYAHLDFARFGRQRRLGLHFEDLVRATLEYSPWSVISHNLPVRKGGQTLGEFDLLLRCGDRVEHWEMAVKFYLGVGEGGAWENWVGPMKKDRLDIKLAKLLSRQCRLGATPEGREVLGSLGVVDVMPRVLLKGYLFYPLLGHAAAPENARKSHLRGFWLPLDRLAELGRFGGLRWAILAKPMWLTAGVLPASVSVFPLSDFAKPVHVAIEEQERPQLVAGLRYENHLWREVVRGFITAPGWPEG